jgi:hypothetical protein
MNSNSTISRDAEAFFRPGRAYEDRSEQRSIPDIIGTVALLALLHNTRR